MTRKKQRKRKEHKPMPEAHVSSIDGIRTMVAERERGGHGTGTVERLSKAEEIEVGHHGTQRIVTAPLDKVRRKLPPSLVQAGEKFRDDGVKGLMDPGAPTVDWGGVGGNFGPKVPSEYASQRVHDHREAYRKAKSFLSKLEPMDLVAEDLIVKEKSFEYIGELIFHWHNRRDAETAGKTALVMALWMLASHYAAARRT